MSGSIHVFVDESGDLGFGVGASKTLVIAYVITPSPERIRVELNRLRKVIHRRHKWDLSEFKFSKDNEFVRERVLTKIQQQDLTVGMFAADKSFVSDRLRDNPRLLYNYIVVDNVITNIAKAFDVKNLEFVIDRSLPQDAIVHFNRYLTDKLSWRQVVALGKEMPCVKISRSAAHPEPCLQVADYCAGAAFNWFERNNKKHYSYVQPKVKFKNSWGNLSW